jgi:hypothetical protein
MRGLVTDLIVRIKDSLQPGIQEVSSILFYVYAKSKLKQV